MVPHSNYIASSTESLQIPSYNIAIIFQYILPEGQASCITVNLSYNDATLEEEKELHQGPTLQLKLISMYHTLYCILIDNDTLQWW